MKKKVFYIIYKIFRNNHKINELNTNGASARYLCFFTAKNTNAKAKENAKIHDRFISPTNAEIAQISFTSPPPKEYGFLK